VKQRCIVCSSVLVPYNLCNVPLCRSALPAILARDLPPPSPRNLPAFSITYQPCSPARYPSSPSSRSSRTVSINSGALAMVPKLTTYPVLLAVSATPVPDVDVEKRICLRSCKYVEGVSRYLRHL
jgi:hypothetical protein